MEELTLAQEIIHYIRDLDIVRGTGLIILVPSVIGLAMTVPYGYKLFKEIRRIKKYGTAEEKRSLTLQGIKDVIIEKDLEGLSKSP